MISHLSTAEGDTIHHSDTLPLGMLNTTKTVFLLFTFMIPLPNHVNPKTTIGQVSAA